MSISKYFDKPTFIMLIFFLLMILSLCFLSSISLAKLYSWIDENGQVYISDKEPALEERGTGAVTKNKVNAKYDFRRTNWGNSKDDVLKSEGNRPFRVSPYTDFDECIGFELQIFGKAGVLSYEFLEGKLVASGYHFLGSGRRGDISVADYMYLKSQLINEYGDPKTEKTDTLPFQTYWETESTEIQINYKINAIPGVNYHVCDIDYKSIKLKPIMEKRYAENKTKQQKEFERFFAESQKKHNTSQKQDSEEFSNATSAIREFCKNKWQDNYRMQEYCINEQEEAVFELKKGKPDDIPLDIFRKIRSQCASKWGTNFRMREHCEKEQFSAWRRMNQ